MKEAWLNSKYWKTESDSTTTDRAATEIPTPLQLDLPALSFHAPKNQESRHPSSQTCPCAFLRYDSSSMKCDLILALDVETKEEAVA
ncbi:MAG TPA: hypothetical protein VK041_04310, partial [Opitutales bacterium]|nr:hypothetical protein [Opitutales bacterium]